MTAPTAAGDPAGLATTHTALRNDLKDDVQSYSNTEPAIDLTATSPLAFARQAAGIR